MSYTRPSCMNAFTQGQITRMHVLCPENIKYNGPTKKPELVTSQAQNICPTTNFNLNQLVTSDIPCGAELIWSTDGNPTDGIKGIVSGLVSENGTYFAYFYYPDENSYGPASDPLIFQK